MTLLRDILYVCVLMHFSSSFYKGVQCTLVIKPKNVTAVGEKTVTFNCAQNGPKGRITWLTMNPRSSNREYIYNGNELVPSVSSYINVSDRDDGNCTLTIKASQAAAKKYICTDRTDGDEASADLLFVMEDYPKCEAQIKGVSVNVRCSVSFAGNWFPKVECKRGNEHKRFLQLQGSQTNKRKKRDSSEQPAKWNFIGDNIAHEIIICSAEFTNTDMGKATIIAYNPEPPSVKKYEVMRTKYEYEHTKYEHERTKYEDVLTATVIIVVVTIPLISIVVICDVKKNGKNSWWRSWCCWFCCCYWCCSCCWFYLGTRCPREITPTLNKKPEKKRKRCFTCLVITVSEDLSEKETETITQQWQTSLFKARYDVIRYVVGRNRVLFLIKDDAKALEVKIFLDRQERCQMVIIEEENYPIKGSQPNMKREQMPEESTCKLTSSFSKKSKAKSPSVLTEQSTDQQSAAVALETKVTTVLKKERDKAAEVKIELGERESVDPKL